MKTLRKLIFVVSTLAAHCLACSCIGPPSNLTTRWDIAEWEIKKSQVIFGGIAEKIELKDWPLKPEPGKKFSTPSRVRVTFSNVNLYRGPQQGQFIVETGLGGGDCGYRFTIGTAYLVYASVDESGKLSTSICTGTVPFSLAATAVRVLRGQPAAPEDMQDPRSQSRRQELPAPHQVCGKISFPTNVKASSATVHFWRADQGPVPLPEESSETDGNGSFCLQLQNTGKFFVGAAQESSADGESPLVGYYPGVRNRAEAQPIVVHDNDETVRADFKVFLQPVYIVRGYLRGLPDGAVDDVFIVLMPATLEIPQMIEPVHLGPHGSFEFHNVPDGLYSAFAATQEEVGAICLSIVAELDVKSDMDGVTLEFVSPTKSAPDPK